MKFRHDFYNSNINLTEFRQYPTEVHSGTLIEFWWSKLLLKFQTNLIAIYLQQGTCLYVAEFSNKFQNSETTSSRIRRFLGSHMFEAISKQFHCILDNSNQSRNDSEETSGGLNALYRRLHIKPDPKWPRIFCIINTMPNKLDRAETVNVSFLAFGNN